MFVVDSSYAVLVTSSLSRTEVYRIFPDALRNVHPSSLSSAGQLYYTTVIYRASHK